MDAFAKALFNLVGRQYEALVYDRARRKQVDAQRDALKLGVFTDEERDERLGRKIELLEIIMSATAELKEISK